MRRMEGARTWKAELAIIRSRRKRNVKEEEDRRSIWRELLGESKEETSRMSGARRNARIEVYEIRGSIR